VNKIFSLLIILIIYSLNIIIAQAPDIEWQNTIQGDGYDRLYSIQQTADGGYILGGYSTSDISGDKTEDCRDNPDYWVVKLDDTGKIEWDKTIGGDDNDKLQSIQQTTDGGYILGGYSESSSSGEKTELCRGREDYWVVKLDGTGNIEWDKTIGGSEYEELRSIQQTADGGYILGGFSESDISGDKTEDSKGNYDYWVVKIDATGQNVEWQKTIGGSRTDNFRSLQQTTDGGYILGGYSSSDISGDKTEEKIGAYDYWIVKLDGTGQTIQWQNTIGGDNGPNQLHSIQQTVDGGYILGGYSWAGISGDKTEECQGGHDYWAVKLDVTGQLIEWQNTIGGDDTDALRCIRQTSDGGYILAGESESGISGDKSEANKGEDDYWIVKLNGAGSIEWDKSFGGNDDDRLQSIQQTSDGGYILGGYSYSGISGDKTEENLYQNAYWVIKLEGSGVVSPEPPLEQNPTIEWQKTIGGSKWDYLRPSLQASDGGFIIGGDSGSDISSDKTEDSQGGMDNWIVKLDATGQTIVWQNTIGGNNDDYLNAIQQTSDGGYILGGSSRSHISGDKTEDSQGSEDYWAVKLDGTGNIEWQNTIGGSEFDRLYTIQQTSDEGYILGGISRSNISGDKTENIHGSDDYWVVKLDATGSIEWQNTIGGSESDRLYNIILTTDGSYILGGSSRSNITGDKTEIGQGWWDFWVVMLDESGNVLWDKTIGGSMNDILYSIQQTKDGGFILGGTSFSSISGDKTENVRGFEDFWVVKLDATGQNIEWQKTIGGENVDDITRIIEKEDGGYILSGTSSSGISGDKTEICKGEDDFWIVVLDATGQNIEWQKTIGGSGDEELSSFSTTTDGGYLLGGVSTSNISGDKTENNRGDYDYWVVKLNPGTSLNIEQIQTLTIVSDLILLPAYPNPFNPNTTIRYGLEKVGKVKVEIYDILGKLVNLILNKEQLAGWYTIVWNGTNHKSEKVPAGQYICKITFGDKVRTTKLMLLK